MTETTQTTLPLPFTAKHHTVFDPNSFTLPVHIIGCGGIGSHIAISLARMGVGTPQSPINLHDKDKFEPHNRANQNISVKHVGWHKVTAVKHQMREINPSIVVQTRRAWVGNYYERMAGVVFLCVDSMTDRAKIMETCLENRPDVKCVIEIRMDAEVGISHCFDPNIQRHCDCWWEQCYTDEEAENMAGCGGYVSIISAVHGTVGLALNQFLAFAQNGSAKNINNRIYQDFKYPSITTMVWETDPHW